MHTAFEIVFDHAWLAGKGFPRERGRALLRLLEALGRTASLRDAARAANLSYRSAWGLLGDAAQLFGAPLVEMQRGKPARLSPLGRSVLAADEHVRAALGSSFERLRSESPPMLAKALPGVGSRLVVHASHDLALETLRESCGAALELEVQVHGADDSLAGFHVADALPRAAAAGAALGRWLDPRKHTLIHFVTREQGLIARPGSRIRGVHDLARPGVRFINRQMDLSVAAAVADGRADAGFGLRAEATRLKLAFVLLARERYFFACARSALRSPALKALLEALRSPRFVAGVKKLPGYDASQSAHLEPLDAALTWVQQPRALPK